MQIKARWVIINPEGKIFLCKLKKEDFFCLPWGTLEEGELVKQCLARELMEELWVGASIGKLLHINDFLRKKNGESVVDLRYEILNPEDFMNIDLSKASHGFENSEVGFYDLDTIQGMYKPETLKSVIYDKSHNKKT